MSELVRELDGASCGVLVGQQVAVCVIGEVLVGVRPGPLQVDPQRPALLIRSDERGAGSRLNLQHLPIRRIIIPAVLNSAENAARIRGAARNTSVVTVVGSA